MGDLFARFGFPSPETRDGIHFYFAKSLSYAARRNLIILLLLAGLALQIILLSFWPGFPFLAAAVLLGLAKGFDSRVRLKNFKNDETWTEVPIEKVREIESVRQKSVSWDRDSFDITNLAGCLALAGIIAVGLVLYFIAGYVSGNPRVAAIVLADFVLVVIPFFITGVRWALKQGNLAIKVRLLLRLHQYFEQHKAESESFAPMILLARDSENKTVPVDVKFRIRYAGLPPDLFYGLHGTVNINLVQGTSHPYFYCVLVANPEFDLEKYKSRVIESKRVTCEYQKQADAKVLVIRHPTSKRSGFATDENAAMEILSAAMGAARTIEAECSSSAPNDGGQGPLSQ